MSDPIDPVTMARFLVMPGAAELLDAFSRIPPGPLREATVAQVRAMADQYTGLGPPPPTEDPLITAARAPMAQAAAEALPSPARISRPRRPATDLEGRIIQLRLEGVPPAEIAKTTGAAALKIATTITLAKHHGVKFPALRARPAGVANFALTVEQLGNKPAAMTAAKKRRMSLERYMQARQTFVTMRRALAPMNEIAKATGIAEKTLWNWLYQARRAGHADLPLRIEHQDAHFHEGPPAAELTGDGVAGPLDLAAGVPAGATVGNPPGDFMTPPGGHTVLLAGQHVFPLPGEASPQARGWAERLAAERGMTPEAFAQLRESIVRHRLDGAHADEIARMTGERPEYVKGVIDYARKRGVVFPPYRTAPSEAA